MCCNMSTQSETIPWGCFSFHIIWKYWKPHAPANSKCSNTRSLFAETVLLHTCIIWVKLHPWIRSNLYLYKSKNIKIYDFIFRTAKDVNKKANMYPKGKALVLPRRDLSLNVWEWIALFMIRWVIFIMREVERRHRYHHHVLPPVKANEMSFTFHPFLICLPSEGMTKVPKQSSRKTPKNFFPHMRIV